MEPTVRPARAAIYVRSSLDGSLPRELAALGACEAYALSHNLDPVLTLEDRAAGAGLDRPGLVALRAAVRDRTIDAVVVKERSHLSRTPADLEALLHEFDAVGVVLHVLPDAPFSERRRLLERGLMAYRQAPRIDDELLDLASTLEEAMRDGDLESAYLAAMSVAHGLAPLMEREPPSLPDAAVPSLAFLHPENEARLEEDRSMRRELPWTIAQELRAAVYARTVDLGGVTSPEEQLVLGKRTGRAIAREQGYRLVTTVEDWTEDGDLDRPGLNALRLLVRARLVDVVVVGSWQMLAQDRATILQLRREFLEHRCTIHSCLFDMPE